MNRFALPLVLLFAACGVSTAEVAAETESFEDDSLELSTTKDTFIIARRDYRRCVSPMCGGYWVRDLNSTMQDKYVSAFDFSQSELAERDQNELRNAPDNEVIVYGRLGPKEHRFDTRTLLVKRGFRAMPGFSFASTDKFYGVFPTKIACITTPCANLQTTRLNRTTGHTMATDFDLWAAIAPGVDPDWLTSRAFSGKTIIAGKIVRQNNHVTVKASQVFVELPDRVAPCPVEDAPMCSGFTIPGYERTPDRCTLSVGCTPIGVCARFEQNCEPGYCFVGWQNICPRFSCEPEFLEE